MRRNNAALFDVAGQSVGVRLGNPVARRYISDHPDNRFVEGKFRAIFVSRLISTAGGKFKESIVHR